MRAFVPNHPPTDLPVGTYQPLDTVEIMGPVPSSFTCTTSDGEHLEGDEGDYIAPDGDGGFFPVSADVLAIRYEQVGKMQKPKATKKKGGR